MPDGYREVKRYLEGSFLFVLKNGPYNRITGTYDGRHGLVDQDEFREYIEKLMKMYHVLYEKASNDERFKKLSRKEMDNRILRAPFFNKNPFETNTFDLDNKEKERFVAEGELIHKKQIYIKEHYNKWNFLNAFSLQTEYPEEPICFYFEFTRSFNGSLFDLINNKKRCICRDGLIKEITDDNFKECAIARNREQAIIILKNIQKLFEEYLENEEIIAVEDYHQYFSISFKRCGAPTHLFKKSEIETAMRNADDRRNNRLVIDENGYVKIISDDEDALLYQVYLEEWNAGNNYVGKYSKLYSLDENYNLCLQGWLQYLITGQIQYMDLLIEMPDEEHLISQIKEFYK